MSSISNLLFWISNGLLVPVVILLLLFLLRAIVMLVGFFGEFYQRVKSQRALEDMLEHSTTADVHDRIATLIQMHRGRLLRTLSTLSAHRDSSAYCERLLANYEVDAEKELGHCRNLMKLGPMLGLMGTLIPMGPALVGLANGDIATMAGNMQVAFATTVVGLVIAVIGIITLQVKQRWYAREQNDLEYVYKLMCHEEK